MRTLNVVFTDEEYKAMEDIKNGLSWRDFLNLMTIHCREAVKRGDLTVG